MKISDMKDVDLTESNPKNLEFMKICEDFFKDDIKDGEAISGLFMILAYSNSSTGDGRALTMSEGVRSHTGVALSTAMLDNKDYFDMVVTSISMLLLHTDLEKAVDFIEYMRKVSKIIYKD